MNSPPLNSPQGPKKTAAVTVAVAAATAKPERGSAAEGKTEAIVRTPITQLVKLDFGGMKFTTSLDTLTAGEGENFFSVSRLSWCLVCCRRGAAHD